MTNAAIEWWRQVTEQRVELIRPEISQRVHVVIDRGDAAQRLLALAASPVVTRVAQLTVHPAVEDHDAEAGRQRDLA